MLPVVPVVQPASLRGRTNGKLAEEAVRMATTPGGIATLATPAHRAWKALAAGAEAAGHVLIPYSSYRTFESQERLFLARYSTKFRAGADTKHYLGKTWYMHSGYVTAAPGTSNHGWGLALDLRVSRNGVSHKIDTAAVDWLVDNEHRWGFSHEIQSERWHIRYFAGDELPAAVLDQPEEDDEVMTPELKAALEGLRSELRADIAALSQRVDDRTGKVFNRVDARTGLIYNAVKGLDLGGPADDIDLEEVLAAIKTLPATVVAQLTDRLNNPT